MERNKPAQLLSQDAQQGLHSFIEGPLLEQIHAENKQKLPPDITFIFGHTHKPFSQDMSFADYPDWMKVYNSGGWVIDAVQPQSIYGAAVILLDETLQATSVRLYNQASHDKSGPLISPPASSPAPRQGGNSEYAVRVEESTRDGSSTTNRGPVNTFYERINGLVKPSSDPWKTFSELVAKAVVIHEQVLQTKINM